MNDDHFFPNISKQNVPYLHTQFNNKSTFVFHSGCRNAISISLTISHLWINCYSAW